MAKFTNLNQQLRGRASWEGFGVGSLDIKSLYPSLTKEKMDPLASLQRIDPYIYQILMAASRVRLYKYIKTEWKESNIEGSFFVYERKCEPCFGFMILNQLSEINEIQNSL